MSYELLIDIVLLFCLNQILFFGFHLNNSALFFTFCVNNKICITSVDTHRFKEQLDNTGNKTKIVWRACQ